ncbi:hypothetical protein [Leisingera methylohalidivorans]|uniref:Uncharacterized protein n=1 Tax=Leisingera methylohalidivorans DSM 14336 TaxID=999552 RepID=V9VYP1_9RHOB|nr:hypothetical protein [Leisingera methylohalidivorans]AHD02849.1 hypothetical protein METH_02735 [Leisingera methylohalidivorans DSM 14336]
MLIDIYARSMMAATRQDCVRLRDLPAPAPLSRPAGRFTRLMRWLTAKPPKTRCIHPQSI